MFPTFDIASSALTTHQTWMAALADNIANINDVKPMSEKAYQ
jgi:flagellar basal-body rod protein FlgC